MVVRRGLATLHELDSVYSFEDLLDLIEMALVDSHNERAVQEAEAAKRKRGDG